MIDPSLRILPKTRVFVKAFIHGEFITIVVICQLFFVFFTNESRETGDFAQKLYTTPKT